MVFDKTYYEQKKQRLIEKNNRLIQEHINNSLFFAAGMDEVKLESK
jgi:hypothetical protein